MAPKGTRSPGATGPIAWLCGARPGHFAWSGVAASLSIALFALAFGTNSDLIQAYARVPAGDRRVTCAPSGTTATGSSVFRVSPWLVLPWSNSPSACSPRVPTTIN